MCIAVWALGMMLMAVNWFGTALAVTVKVAVPTTPLLEAATIVVFPGLMVVASPAESTVATL
jgi:hypothetical protein